MVRQAHHERVELPLVQFVEGLHRCAEPALSPSTPLRINSAEGFQSFNRCASFNALGGSKARPELAERVSRFVQKYKEVMVRVSDLSKCRNAVTRLDT
jgi:hypothetical protein